MHIEPLPRLAVRLLSLTAPLRRCFVLYTFSKGADNLPIRTDKMCPNHSYCAACHCSTTRDVALDAFNSKLFSLGTYFSSLCDLNLHLGLSPQHFVSWCIFFLVPPYGGCERCPPTVGPPPRGGLLQMQQRAPPQRNTMHSLTLSSRGWCPGPDDGSLAETKSWLHRSMRSAGLSPVAR